MVSASDLGSVIAKRQVNTHNLRMGTRRLSARQNGPSVLPAVLLSQYIDCPAASNTNTFGFYSSSAMRTAATSGPAADVDCIYRDLTDATIQYTCSYNGDSGALTSSPSPLNGNNGLLAACDRQLATAPVTGSCAQACPRQPNGLWYANSALSNSGGFIETTCTYANSENEAMAGQSAVQCVYEAGAGTFVRQTGTGTCPGSLGISSYCVANKSS